MTSQARVTLARTTYHHALSAARRDCTPARWRRLVRAWWNLKDALRQVGLDASTARREHVLGLPTPGGLAP